MFLIFKNVFQFFYLLFKLYDFGTLGDSNFGMMHTYRGFKTYMEVNGRNKFINRI